MQKSKRMATYIDRAWAAGFFEGEGCFYAHYYKPRDDGSRVMRVAASLVQKDVRLLRRFLDVVGFGKIGAERRGGMHAWKTSRVGEARKLFAILAFQLGDRRTARFTELDAAERAQVFRPKKKPRIRCRIGHRLESVGVRRDGTCAECDRLYKRNWYHTHRRLK